MAWRGLPPNITDRVIADVDPLSRLAVNVARSGANAPLSSSTFKFLRKLSNCLVLLREAFTVSEHAALNVIRGPDTWQDMFDAGRRERWSVNKADSNKFNIICPTGHDPFIPDVTERELLDYFGQVAARGGPLTVQVPYFGTLKFSSPDFQLQPELRRLVE